MPLYAAYGTNMAPAQMLRHAPHSPLAGTAWLEGWRLTFAGEDMSCWEGALATVVEDPDSRVMYYDYSTDAGATWSELYLWPEETGDDITFMLPVTEAEEEKLLIRAYNTYELRTEAYKSE